MLCHDIVEALQRLAVPERIHISFATQLIARQDMHGEYKVTGGVSTQLGLKPVQHLVTVIRFALIIDVKEDRIQSKK